MATRLALEGRDRAEIGQQLCAHLTSRIQSRFSTGFSAGKSGDFTGATRLVWTMEPSAGGYPGGDSGGAFRAP
jgi:hypothetical protein